MKIDESGKPMMSDDDIKTVTAMLYKHQALVCLEWGAGNSTIYFPRIFKYAASWVSVEHDGHYIDYLAPKIDPLKVTMIWTPESEVPNDNYVDCVKHNVNQYDFILIDGISEQREKCLAAAIEMIKPTGVVLLHDSGRPEYQKFIEKYPKRERLTMGEIATAGGFIHQGLTAFYK